MTYHEIFSCGNSEQGENCRKTLFVNAPALVSGGQITVDTRLFWNCSYMLYHIACLVTVCHYFGVVMISKWYHLREKCHLVKLAFFFQKDFAINSTSIPNLHGK